MGRVRRRAAIITDEVTGLDVPARRVRKDEHGRYTTDPDAPHPQRFLLPVAPERAPLAGGPDRKRNPVDVLIIVGFYAPWPHNEALPVPTTAINAGEWPYRFGPADPAIEVTPPSIIADGDLGKGAIGLGAWGNNAVGGPT